MVSRLVQLLVVSFRKHALRTVAGQIKPQTPADVQG